MLGQHRQLLQERVGLPQHLRGGRGIPLCRPPRVRAPPPAPGEADAPALDPLRRPGSYGLLS